MNSFLKSCRIPGIAMLTLISLGVALSLTVSHLQEEARIDFEKSKSEWRQKWFDEVKDGQNYATIMDTEIIPMLADDPVCVQNLTELHFSMVTIEPSDALLIKQLVHVKHLMFYDTHGVDAVLESAKRLPIESIAFDMARPTEASLKSLAEFQSLNRVHFEHIVYPREIAILESLDPKIQIDAMHRAEADSSR